jgi:hypothetical protein
MLESNYIKLSTLSHTWVFDLDGTIFLHNSHLSGEDTVLPGVIEFWAKIPNDDLIIIITARSKKYRDQTVSILNQNQIRFDHLIFDAPVGERILFNDLKPFGLKTAIAFNIKRNEGFLNFDLKIEDI